MYLFVSILYSFSVYLLIAYSLYLVYSASKCLYFSHASSVAIGAYLTYWLYIECSLPFYISVLSSIIITGLLLLCIDKFVYYPLHKIKCPTWQLMIVSLGVYVILQNLLSLIWGNNILSYHDQINYSNIILFGTTLNGIQLLTIFSAVVLVMMVWLILENTNKGKRIKAVASNPDLSSLFGINKFESVVLCTLLGSAMASFAGILIAADTYLVPSMGFNWFLYAVIAMIIGQSHKVSTLAISSLFLSIAQNIVALYVDSKWMVLTAYIILIVFLYFRPYGFSGKRLKKSSL